MFFAFFKQLGAMLPVALERPVALVHLRTILPSLGSHLGAAS
jgi:hypothetical protein